MDKAEAPALFAARVGSLAAWSGCNTRNLARDLRKRIHGGGCGNRAHRPADSDAARSGASVALQSLMGVCTERHAWPRADRPDPPRGDRTFVKSQAVEARRSADEARACFTSSVSRNAWNASWCFCGELFPRRGALRTVQLRSPAFGLSPFFLNDRS